MTVQVAIVGSGPAGCYTAQALLKTLPGVRITLVERLPVPFGLVRYGVAADHQGTKSVARQFDRVLTHPDVAFVGNVDVGIDISLEALRSSFDAVVIATGLDRDRRLGIAGEDLPGVIPSGRLTRWANGHPDVSDAAPLLCRRAVVIGNGNVAIDVVRLLAKAESDFVGSDLPGNVASALAAVPVEELVVAGRGTVDQARFDPAMVKELAQIGGATFEIVGLSSADASPQAAALRHLEERQGRGDRVTVRFRFGWTPLRMEGAARVEEVVFADATGTERPVATDVVVSAIGFTGPAALVPDDAPADAGRLAAGLYCVGWARRGARGTIPEARADARVVAGLLVDDLEARRSSPVRSDPHRCFMALPATDLGGWHAIERYERATAADGRIRNKVTDRRALLQLARPHLNHLEGEPA
ncbi:FAD-dependent oxidoreductase [Nocardioides sp. SLBN-35]|uniref:FAD-dependent oxidoreductase n=1 Tax=Nocardioides sp. SLBN-35 TaxID=2768445 RepID=UPI00114F9C32|nr:FAD-dependent oxidoreductase [Nocardioides sp. SLBN-35]TQK71934.1 ferredoxin--NADP+ reductase [Nocardioides sp. SLBN-35]